MDIQNQNIENTLKKMGLVLEKLVKKIDELDRRVANLENKDSEKKFSSEDLKVPQTAQHQSSTSKSSLGGFGSSFLGSMAGAMAGMGLYNLLFNHSVNPDEFGKEIGMSDDEINEALENNFDEINSKLDELDSKMEGLDTKLDTLTDEDLANNDYFESYENEDLNNSDFDSGFDDFDGFDEI